MRYPAALRYTPTRFWASLGLAIAGALLLAACAGAITPKGVRLKVFGAANDAVADMDRGAAERDEPVSGFDWTGLLGQIAMYVGGGLATVYGGHKVIGLSASKTDWTAEERADIKAIAAAPPETPKA